MATQKHELITFEFSSNGSVLGRATWLGAGMIELDFEDAAVRKRFEKGLSRPEPSLGPVFDLSNLSERWPDETKQWFADACFSYSGIYQVRRVH